MIKVDGHTFLRSGEKIGFIDGDYIKNHDGDKVGYCRDEHVFDMAGHKLAYIEDDRICFRDSSRKIRVEDNNDDIVGGDLSNLQKAAVRVLLGE